MGNITQQSIPPHSYPMSPMMPSHTTKAAQSDMFLDMIQGPAIPVLVGSAPSLKQYTLPVALLCVHSIWFRTELTRLNDLTAATDYSKHVNKKRKLSPVTGVDQNTEKVTKIESVDIERNSGGEEESAKTYSDNSDSEERKEVAKKPEMVIRLPDVDPAIFGLFLKFIYKNSFPDNIDARGNPARTPSVPATPSRRYSTYMASVASTNADTSVNVPQAAPGGHMPSLPPTPPSTPLRRSPMAPPPAFQGVTNADIIPLSVHAWLLAQRLGAMSFMNHCITRVFSGIGTFFALTPTLMDHVWNETAVIPPSSSSSSMSETTTKPSAVLHPSPLRKLFMDVLVAYWSHPNPVHPNAVILRSFALSPHFSTPLKHAWDQLFDAHKDLREDFIHGLQGGSQLLQVHGYFVSSVIRAEKVMKEMGHAASGKRRGRETGYDVVVVKKEHVDDEVVETGSKEKKGKTA